MSEAISHHVCNSRAVNARRAFVFADCYCWLAHIFLLECGGDICNDVLKKCHSIIDFTIGDVYNLAISLSFRGGQEV